MIEKDKKKKEKRIVLSWLTPGDKRLYKMIIGLFAVLGVIYKLYLHPKLHLDLDLNMNAVYFLSIISLSYIVNIAELHKDIYDKELVAFNRCINYYRMGFTFNLITIFIFILVFIFHKYLIISYILKVIGLSFFVIAIKHILRLYYVNLDLIEEKDWSKNDKE